MTNIKIPDELFEELKTLATGFICVNNLVDKIRIFIMNETPVILYWDGGLVCKSKRFRKILEDNVIIKEYLV